MLNILFSLLVGGVFSAVASEDIPSVIAGRDIAHDVEARIDLKSAEKASVIVFLSVRCPCSRSHEQVLDDLNLAYRTKGIQFVGVHSNPKESDEEYKDHYKNVRGQDYKIVKPSAFSFPVIQDNDLRLANTFKAAATPHVFIISPQLEILYKGGVDPHRSYRQAEGENYIRSALDEILQGRKPNPSERRVIGCQIR